MNPILPTQRHLLTVLLVAFTSACGAGEQGGLTAQFRFPASGSQKSAQTRGVPPEIDRLEISALSTDGSTVAEVALDVAPAEGEQQLERSGGTWRLDGVPVGEGLRLRAVARLGPSATPGLEGQPALVGEVSGVTVRSERVTDVGVIDLELLPGARLPSLDFESPGAPGTLTTSKVPAGGAVLVSFRQPTDPDATGYFIAVTSSASVHLSLPRGEVSLELGAEIAPGVVVRDYGEVEPGASVSATLDQLVDDEGVFLIVHAFDRDFEGVPLNFSGETRAFAVASDELAPSPVSGLQIRSLTATSAEIRFVATGEDGGEGLPDHYELRAAELQEELLDPLRFAILPEIAPPPVLAPGQSVVFERSFEELGMLGVPRFFIGLRAVDQAGNAGEIGTAEWTNNASVTPVISQLRPEVALAGSDLSIEGAGFGADPGGVSLSSASSTASFTLPVLAWTDRSIRVQVPPASESGLLTVARASGEVASAYAAVVARIPDQPTPANPPFASVSTADANGRAVAALYYQTDNGGVFEQKVDRFVRDQRAETVAPLLFNDPMIGVAGSVSPTLDTVAFVASTSDPASMTAVIASGDTPASTQRIANIAAVGNVEDLALELLESPAGGARVPALLAFSSAGVIRTASVADMRTERFFRFVVVSPGGAPADRARLARRPNLTSPATAPILLAYREGDPGAGVLRLMDAVGDGGGVGDFTVRPPDGAPEIGDGLVVLDTGTRFLVIYEERLADRTEVRVLPAASYGSSAGFAPFADATADRRLADAGLVRREGRVYLALATVIERGASSRQLNYVEIPADDLPSSGRGDHIGIDLDFADAAAVLGCKPRAMLTCPISWVSDYEPQILFLRR